VIDDFGKDKGPNPLDEFKPKQEEVKRRTFFRTDHSGLTVGLSVLFLFLGFVVFILLGFYFIVPELPENQFDYGPYHFVKEPRDGTWKFDWQRDDRVYSVPLRYSPYEVENVIIQGSINESFNRPEVYVTFDPTQGNFSTLALATGELSLNMVRALQVTPIGACTVADNEACIERPIVTCGDEGKSVILIKDEGEAKIWLKGDCIILFGKDFELLRAVDRLLYQWYEVIQ